jgi:hypothetical protein
MYEGDFLVPSSVFFLKGNKGGLRRPPVSRWLLKMLARHINLWSLSWLLAHPLLGRSVAASHLRKEEGAKESEKQRSWQGRVESRAYVRQISRS